jgi:hypothetical protein
MFDSHMPQVNNGSDSIVVVCVCALLELVGAIVCGHDGLTKSCMFVRVVIRAGG